MIFTSTDRLMNINNDRAPLTIDNTVQVDTQRGRTALAASSRDDVTRDKPRIRVKQ